MRETAGDAKLANNTDAGDVEEVGDRPGEAVCGLENLAAEPGAVLVLAAVQTGRHVRDVLAPLDETVPQGLAVLLGLGREATDAPGVAKDARRVL